MTQQGSHQSGNLNTKHEIHKLILLKITDSEQPPITVGATIGSHTTSGVTDGLMHLTDTNPDVGQPRRGNEPRRRNVVVAANRYFHPASSSLETSSPIWVSDRRPQGAREDVGTAFCAGIAHLDY